MSVELVYRTDAPWMAVDGEPVLAKPRRDSNGFLHCEGKVARIGVMAYPQASGKVVHEFVSPEILFDAASMASLAGLPITDRHPLGPDGRPMLVRPDTASGTQLGSVSGPGRREGRYLVAPLTITDAGLIAKVEAGEQVELSPGYPSLVTLDPGVWTHPEYAPAGERYDSAQGRRLYNHVALVPKGRCTGIAGDGSHVSCAIRTDEQGALPMAAAAAPTVKTWKIRTDGATASVPIDQLKGIVASMDPKKALAFLFGLLSAGDDAPVDVPAMDAAKPPMAEGKEGAAAPGDKPMTDEEKKAYMANQTRTDAVIAEFKSQQIKDQARIDGLQDKLAAITAAQGAQPGAVRQRLDLERKAQRVLGERFDASQMTDDQLRVEVLSALYPARKEKFATAVPEYLAVRFDEAIEDHANASRPRRAEPVVHADAAGVPAPGDLAASRRRMIANTDKAAAAR